MQPQNRKTRVHRILDQLSRFRCCGPSDDPDEQTSVVESYKYLVIHLKILSRGLIPSELFEQVEAIPDDLEHIYAVYDAKARLDAILPDIEAALDDPTSPLGEPAPQYCLVSRTLIDALAGVESSAFDTTKLIGYCMEINSSFYHGNVIATLLLMRTVLNHVPPIFGHSTFDQVAANASKSLRDNFSNLQNGLRKLADFYAHQPIRSREEYPTKNQVEPFRAQFELLLQEAMNHLK